MQSKSNNIVHLNQKSAQHDLLEDVCNQLNQLTIEHIHPVSDSLIPHLITRLDEELEQTTNNHDIMMTMEVKNALLKNSSKIISSFKELTSTSNLKTTSAENEEASDLILLDNLELDHKLIWINAAERIVDKKNSQQLFRIKNRFEHAFPDFTDQVIPASPEKLCESFSTALEVIHPTDKYVQKLLLWFTQFIREQANALWNDADKLLEKIGLELNVSIKPPESHSHRANSASGEKLQSSQSPPSSGHPDDNKELFSENLSPAFMDSLAAKLVTQVENMLIRDDLIPESKKYQLRTGDLAGILANLQVQVQVMEQHASLNNLTESIRSALEKRGDKSKLSSRHENLINLVGMLFEFIIDDHALPENVRKSLGLLQIPVLRTAILDHDFLTEREHPARILLNEMTTAGMQCTENSFTDPVYLLIDRIIHIIISQSYDNPEIFKDSLERFRTELATINQPQDEPGNELHNGLSSQPDDDNTPKEMDLSEYTEPEELLPKETEFENAEEIILESLTSEFVSEEELSLGDTEETAPTEILDDSDNTQQTYTLIEGLRIGQWVEFIGERDAHRTSYKLARINKDINRYIFENRSGMKVAEWDGKQLLNCIETGVVIIQENTQIFDRALQAVFEKFKKH